MDSPEKDGQTRMLSAFHTPARMSLVVYTEKGECVLWDWSG